MKNDGRPRNRSSIFTGYDEMLIDIVTHNDGHYRATPSGRQWKDDAGELSGQEHPSIPKRRSASAEREIDKKALSRNCSRI